MQETRGTEPSPGNRLFRDGSGNIELLQHFVESFFIEANDQLFSDAQNRRTQCSRSTQNQSGHFVPVVVFLQVKVDELLSSRHVKFFHPVEQSQRVVAFVSDFAGIDFLDRLDTVVRKKLLRFFTGRSARAVIAPVNLRHRVISF